MWSSFLLPSPSPSFCFATSLLLHQRGSFYHQVAYLRHHQVGQSWNMPLNIYKQAEHASLELIAMWCVALIRYQRIATPKSVVWINFANYWGYDANSLYSAMLLSTTKTDINTTIARCVRLTSLDGGCKSVALRWILRRCHLAGLS